MNAMTMRDCGQSLMADWNKASKGLVAEIKNWGAEANVLKRAKAKTKTQEKQSQWKLKEEKKQ